MGRHRRRGSPVGGRNWGWRVGEVEVSCGSHRNRGCVFCVRVWGGGSLEWSGGWGEMQQDQEETVGWEESLLSGKGKREI